MNPAVLVLSHGSATPTDVIKSTLEANGVDKIDCKPAEESDLSTIPTYLCNLKTKYYQNTLQLMPITDRLDSVPKNIENITEAIIIYFDGDKKLFLNELPTICSWLLDHNIELGILITKQFADDINKGITRSELHKICSESKFIFNVIELSQTDDESNDSDESDNEKHEYHEIVDALKNNVWSNVECNQINPNNITPATNENEENVESQLEAFESLLINVQNFQRFSGTLTRDQLLDEADKLVGMFCNTIGDDFGDDDADEDDNNVDQNNDDSETDGTLVDN